MELMIYYIHIKLDLQCINFHFLNNANKIKNILNK